MEKACFEKYTPERVYSKTKKPTWYAVAPVLVHRPSSQKKSGIQHRDAKKGFERAVFCNFRRYQKKNMASLY